MVASVTPLAHGDKAGYPTATSSAAVIEKMVVMVGIPLGNLGQLLGVEGYHNTYRWRMGVRRPSALILNRFLELLYLKNVQGVRLAMIRRVDWETGLITLHDGTEQQVRAQEPNHSLKGWTIG